MAGLPSPPDVSTRLPHIDAPALEVEAEPHRVWAALLDRLPRSPRGAGAVAALLGCTDRRRSGDPAEPGSTWVGFRVVAAEPASRLALAGEHRFSRYTLTFTIDDLGAGRSRLRAATDAAFPGVAGGAYRGLVIRSGIHARVTRSMLESIRDRAERREA